MSDLKPCPFCGAPAELVQYANEDKYAIKCTGCPVAIRWYEPKDEQIANWNHRTQPEATAPAQKLTLENAPIGTKAPATMGGAWTRTELGWKWDGGSTFPRPGGDWNGDLIAPAQDLSAAKKEWRGSLAQVICDVPIPEGSYKYQHGFVTAKETILEALRKAGFDALSAGDRVDAETPASIVSNHEFMRALEAYTDTFPRAGKEALIDLRKTSDYGLIAAIDAAIIQSQKAK